MITRVQSHLLRPVPNSLRCGWAPVLFIAVAGCGSEPATPPTSTAATATAEPQPQTESPPPQADEDPELPLTTVTEVQPQPELDEPHVLFNTLASPDTSPEDWEKAQNRLIELGETAVPALERELKSQDARRREIAASGLAMLGPASATAVPALKEALQDESIYVRANAATALCAIPEQEPIVIPALVKLLISEDPQVRQMSAVNLSNFGPEAAPHVQDLTAALEQAPDDVLVALLELVGRIGPEAKSAAPHVQQIAFEQSGDAQQAAQAALERINDAPADE